MGVFIAAFDVLFGMLSNVLPGGPDATGVSVAVAYADDLDFVRRLQRRDRKAIADFIAAYADAVYTYVRFRLAPRTDQADDVVQNVFLAAWQSLGSYRGSSPLRTWLLGIARHKVEDIYRERLKQEVQLSDEVSETFADDSLAPDGEIDRKRLRERATAILNELPEAYAAVLLWRYWDHRSTTDIAVATGRTEKAVERMLSRARQSFRRRWDHGRS